MKLNTKLNLKERDGKDVSVDNKPIPLAEIIVNALYAMTENQYQMYLIGKKIVDAKGEVEITSEEMVSIKTALERSKMSASVFGQIVDHIEK